LNWLHGHAIGAGASSRARQGIAEPAIIIVAVQFRFGLRTAADPIESYAWAEVAVVEGFGFAKVERESAFKSMSPRDREEAATRAAAILAEVRRPPSTLNNPK
jgi:hypothetical protein